MRAHRFLSAFLLVLLLSGPTAAGRVRVRPGDTLWSIAEANLGDGHRWREVAAANPDLDPNRLVIGAWIELPEPGGMAAGGAPVPAAPPATAPAGSATAERVRRTIRAADEAGAPPDLLDEAERVLAAGDVARALRLAEAAAAAVGIDRLAARVEPAGPVQARASTEAAWTDLGRGEYLGAGAWVRTSDRGRAALAADGVSLAVDPTSIVRIAELLRTPEGARVGWDLFVGAAVLDVAEGRRARLSAGDAAAEAEGPTRFRAEVGADGGLRVEVVAGAAEVRAGATRETIVAGRAATLRPSGGISVEERPAAIELAAPAENARVDVTEARTVSFSWGALEGASAYRFRLFDGTGERILIDRRVEGTTVDVSGVPDGAYRWTAAPLWPGGLEGAAPAPRRFLVGAIPPALSVDEIGVRGDRLLLSGRTEAGARLWVGPAEVEVGKDGAWSAEVSAGGADGGLHVVGVVAEAGRGPAASGRAAALAVRAAGKGIEEIDGRTVTARETIPLILHVPEGARIEVEGAAVADVALRSGMNPLRARLTLDEATAEGATEVLLDREGPRILSVEATPGVIRAGEPVSIRVAVRDDGAGPAPAARIEVGGPEGAWERDVPGTDGAYEVVVETDRRSATGVLRVRRVVVRDRLGNETELASDAALVTGVGGGMDATWSVLMVGVGLAIGAAL